MGKIQVSAPSQSNDWRGWRPCAYPAPGGAPGANTAPAANTDADSNSDPHPSPSSAPVNSYADTAAGIHSCIQHLGWKQCDLDGRRAGEWKDHFQG